MLGFLRRNKKPKSNSSNPDLVKVYKDASGVEYYTYKNPMQLPAMRAIAVERATRYANMYLTEDTMQQLIAALKQAGNKQDWVRVFSIIQELELRSKFLAEEQSLLEVAQYYFLEENENPEILNEQLLQAKVKRWQGDIFARAFFLKTALGYIRKYSGISTEKLMNYLAENEPNEKRLHKFILANT